MQPDPLKQILTSLLSNPARLEDTAEQIRQLTQQQVDADRTDPRTAEVDGAAVDLDRSDRCGFPEVVYGEGKSPELVVSILRRQRESGQYGLVTRIDAATAELLQAEFPDGIWNEKARTFRLGPTPTGDAQVAVVSAGSTDVAVAQEAVETLLWMGQPVLFVEDVGVAGPQRLQAHVPALQQMSAIVCVAGMEAALPSVLGGYVRCPVIGVPTSVGYGASLGGLTALMSMLTCCASNVVTVNIDSGFRGGYAAGLMVLQSRQQQKQQQAADGSSRG